MKINHKHYTLILLAVVCITVSILAYLFIYKKTVTQAEYYVTATKDIESENGKKQKEEELLKLYQKSSLDRQEIINIFVNEDKIVEFIEQIEKVGVDSKTKLELGGLTNTDGKIKAKVTASGSWQGVMTALSLVENLPRSISIDAVSLVSSGKEWNISFGIEVLSKK